MSATIYHNPKCGTSRAVLALLREAGIEPEIIEYLKTPLDRPALTALIGQLNLPLRDLIRTKEAVYKDLNLDNPALTDSALVDAIIAHPILLNRPIVITPRGAKLCRPAETIRDLL